MRRYLIVANRTLTGPHVIAEVVKREAEGPCRFHLMVPAVPTHSSFWTEGEALVSARANLDQALHALREAGVETTGEIGDESPVLAVGDVLRRESFDEIILSTLPPGVSRWLKRDLPHRLERTYHLPVTHLIASRQPIT